MLKQICFPALGGQIPQDLPLPCGGKCASLTCWQLSFQAAQCWECDLGQWMGKVGRRKLPVGHRDAAEEEPRGNKVLCR